MAEETTPTPQENQEAKPKSPIEEFKEIRDELRKERELIEAANKEKAELMTNQLLAGTSGGAVESKPKEETPKEYMEKVMSGQVKPNE